MQKSWYPIVVIGSQEVSAQELSIPHQLSHTLEHGSGSSKPKEPI